MRQPQHTEMCPFYFYNLTCIIISLCSHVTVKMLFLCFSMMHRNWSLENLINVLIITFLLMTRNSSNNRTITHTQILFYQAFYVTSVVLFVPYKRSTGKKINREIKESVLNIILRQWCWKLNSGSLFEESIYHFSSLVKRGAWISLQWQGNQSSICDKVMEKKFQTGSLSMNE